MLLNLQTEHSAEVHKWKFTVLQLVDFHFANHSSIGEYETCILSSMQYL